MGLFSVLFGKGEKIKSKLAEGAIIIDVRTLQEFNNGHIQSSENIPLQQLNSKIKQLKSSNKPIIFCCASGGRSAQATSIAKSNGIDCINGGGWRSLSRHV